MENVVLTIHLILALMLIGVVLLQRSEGGGLGMGGTGGVMSGRSAATALTRLTWIFAILFICTSITLTIIGAGKTGRESIIDQIDAQVSEQPTDGENINDLLPPIGSTSGTSPILPGGTSPLIPPKSDN